MESALTYSRRGQMPLEPNVSRRQIETDRLALELFDLLATEQADLGLESAKLYYRFPRYRGTNGELVSADLVLASPLHGLLAFIVTDATDQNAAGAIPEAVARCDQAYSAI